MIEILDARAARWPTPLRWLYVGMKWSLAAIGGFILIGVLHQRTAQIAASLHRLTGL